MFSYIIMQPSCNQDLRIRHISRSTLFCEYILWQIVESSRSGQSRKQDRPHPRAGGRRVLKKRRLCNDKIDEKDHCPTASMQMVRFIQNHEIYLFEVPFKTFLLKNTFFIVKILYVVTNIVFNEQG